MTPAGPPERSRCAAMLIEEPRLSRGRQRDVALVAPFEVDAAASALAEAFVEDPFFRHFVPPEAARRRILPAVMAANLRLTLPEGATWQIAAPEGGIAGAVGALPPGCFPASIGRNLAFLARLLLRPRPWLPGPGAYRRGWPYLAAWDRLHREVREPHWYVFIIGVRPGLQGRGLGRGLMEPILEAADADGVAVYLETQNAANLPFYRAFGFRPGESVAVEGGGPRIRPLLRPASR